MELKVYNKMKEQYLETEMKRLQEVHEANERMIEELEKTILRLKNWQENIKHNVAEIYQYLHN